jgi:hypothetical protein
MVSLPRPGRVRVLGGCEQGARLLSWYLREREAGPSEGCWEVGER